MANPSTTLEEIESSGEAQLLALVDLLRTSVDDIIKEHKNAGIPIPSLDSASPLVGGFDRIESTTPGLRHAVRIVQGACAELTAIVSNPGLLMFTKALAFAESACLQLAISTKVADHLEGHPEGMHVTDLESKCGIPADNLGRTLRFLSTRHIFIEHERDVFSNNRLSMQLRSEASACAIAKLLVNQCFQSSPFLYETLSDPSTTPGTSAFEKRNGLKLFDYLESDQGHDAAPMFAKAMRGIGDISGKSILTEVYPWGSLPKTSEISICDVVGNTGHVVMALLKAFPEHNFKAIVQDLPGMLAQGAKLWEAQFPAAIEKKRVEFVPVDFLKEAPVAGCDFYYLRLCLHNWPDSHALEILRNIAKAMRAKPLTSRFLLHDFVLRRATSATKNEVDFIEGLYVAPAPLLANFGAASCAGYNMDINMMGLLAAKERTLDELLDLSSQAGLSFERFWDAGIIDILEFSLPQEVE
ncbi:S-adenosyl-L-methionine-dependent methyltransferase [Schizopora paradoxa]|uniref:S-adenosyl-L-methionine-dependent methyltransferase n=1 Tax=Schizopora paradoxa TaxID=27342 RepID=A0A0H2RVZ9_9AGAM|nr:S-adenosyl-L-methionine-dependent methyltransferase [Schizopora paradoxa]